MHNIGEEQKMNVQVDKATIDQITKDLQDGGFENHTRIGFLTGKINGNDILVDGIYVPEQESSPGIALISPENTLNSYEAIRNSGNDIVGIGQYNNHFPAFESAIDLTARKALPNHCIPAVSIIMNKKGDYEIFKD